MDGMPSVEEMQLRQQQAAEQEERRSMLIEQIVENPAKERLNRLKLVKPDKARAVEDSLIAAATSGRLKGKVSEEQLIAMLEQLGGSGPAKSSSGRGITVQRRKYDDDDDNDNDDDLL